MARTRRAKAGSMRIRAKMSLLDKVLIDPTPALTRDEGGVGVEGQCHASGAHGCAPPPCHRAFWVGRLSWAAYIICVPR